MINISIDIKPLTERLSIITDRLSNPNWDEMINYMTSSVKTNFEVGGRPAWQQSIFPSRGKTLGGTQSRLFIDKTVTKFTDGFKIVFNTPWGSVHQSISTQRPKISTRSHNYFLARGINAKKSGSPDMNMWFGLAKKKVGETIDIAERRFAKFQIPLDVDNIKQIFLKGITK